MNDRDKHDVLDRNLIEMFSKKGDPPGLGFQQRLTDVVGREVQRQHRVRLQRRWLARMAVAAVVLIATLLAVQRGLLDDEPIATITDVRGLVVVRNGHRPEVVEGRRSVHAQQWVHTRSGTTAQVLLTDQSQLTPRPRTVMQLDRQRYGHIVRLEKGSVTIAAHKQPAGRYLTVETPGTAIKVLGTTLDVRVIEKPAGLKQTHVQLYSGTVEVASGGVSVLLLPGMVSVAEAGRSPVAQSSVLEVNELRRLLQETQRRAEQAGAQANMPMIIDCVSSTAWAIVPLSRFDRTEQDMYSLRLKYPAFGVKAYTGDGAEADARGQGRVLHVDLSQRPQAAGEATHIILRMPQATGLFHIDNGVYEFAIPAASEPSVTLVQLLLPKSAQVQALCGEIVETSERLGRSVVTVQADCQTFQVYE